MGMVPYAEQHDLQTIATEDMKKTLTRLLTETGMCRILHIA